MLLLANPVVVPVFADPITWLIAVGSMWAEIVVVLAVLRRCGVSDSGLTMRLLVVQLVTWIPFLFLLSVLHQLGLSTGLTCLAVGLLELLIFVLEIGLIRSIAEPFFGAPGLQAVTIAVKTAVLASLAGNATSLIASLLVACAVVMALSS